MFGWFRRKAPDNDPATALKHFERGDYDEALRCAEAVIMTNPHVGMSWRFRGECLFQLERYLEAAESFREAEEVGGPGVEEVFLWRALSFYNAGRKDEARSILREFLARSQPADPELVSKARDALARFEV